MKNLKKEQIAELAITMDTLELADATGNHGGHDMK